MRNNLVQRGNMMMEGLPWQTSMSENCMVAHSFHGVGVIALIEPYLDINQEMTKIALVGVAHRGRMAAVPKVIVTTP